MIWPLIFGAGQLKKEFWLSASHVPGVENNKPEIDLFAACLNAKCESYVLLEPDPNAFAVDAFTQKWNGIKGYAFLPFSLIGRFLAKIKRDQALIIVVVLCWQTQLWFPQFLRVMEHGTVLVYQYQYRAETFNMEETTTDSDTFVTFVQMEGLTSDVNDVIMASWRPGTKAA